jgi:O-glycosyl hydrolase
MRKIARRPRSLALASAAATLLATCVGTVALTSSQASAAAGAAVITAPAQTIAGFGASGAWWVNDLVNFSPSVQAQVASLLFTTSGIDLSQYRYNIGGGGAGVTVAARAPESFLTSSGTYDWSNDPGGQYFLKAAAADGVPDLVGFVNSAPGQDTTNGENCDDEINTADDAAYGTYLATVASHFAAEGVDIDQISPMNEPDNDFSGCTQEGMEVPASERAGVIDAVGSALSAAGLSTRVIADESSETTQLLSEAPTWLANASAPGYIAAIAHHTYDNPSDSELEQVGGLGDVNDKPVWATEICCQISGGGGYGAQYDPTMAGALTMTNYIYTDLSYADDAAFDWWTALSSSLGCDPETDSTCATTVNTNSTAWNDGLIYYDPDYASDGNQTLYMTKRFYALGQYSRFVRPGAVRYGVSGAPSGVQTMAFWDNNQWTVIATNTNTSATSLSVNLGSGTITSSSAYQTDASENLASISAPTISGSTITASLPAQSVTSYVLNSSGAPGSGGTSAQEFVGNQSGKCLDVPNLSTANGTQLDIWTCNAGSNQEYTLAPSGEITVYGDECLEAYEQGKTAGTIVDIYTCNGGANQLWQVHPDGSITNDESGLCLDVYGQGTANGTDVELYTCNGGTNQQWTLG